MFRCEKQETDLRNLSKVILCSTGFEFFAIFSSLLVYSLVISELYSNAQKEL